MATREPGEIRQEIERTREELASSLVSLKRNVSETTDWHAWVRRQPLAYLGGVFALGVIVGAR